MMYGGGGYYNQGRQLEPFRSTPSARSSIQRETERLLRESLQGAAEYARQNDPMARAVIGRSEDLVVGQDGPRVEWDTGDAEWDTLAGRLWERYFHDVGPGTMDAQGLVAGPQLLRQSHSAVYVSGRYAWLGTGLADDGEADDATGGITLVDGVRIINPGASLDSDECVAGVQLDGRGRLAGVNVADWAHGGMHLDYATTLYDRCFGYVPNPLATELGMIAPPPALAVALVSITQLQSVLWSVVHAVNKEAGENIAVKTTDPDDDLFEGSASRDPDAPGLRVGRDGRLEHGLGADGYTRLAPGEELVGVASNYPQQALEPFIRSMLIQVGAPFGITYEMLTGDFRGSNFSAAKLSMQLTGRRIGVMQSSMASMLLRPVIARVFIPAMILKGELDAARLPEGWDRPEITPAPLPDPDPQKTAVRVLTDLRTGMRTQRDNARERGQTLEEYRRELADDAAFLDSISVVNPMGSDPSAAETPAAVADLVSDEVPGERAGGPEAGGGGRGENATDPGNPADATGDTP
jgi:capsid protein